MSVKASERGESPIEFLKVLRDLEVYFIRLASNKPKKFRFFLNDELLKISADAYNNAKAGNSIYPTTKMEKDLRAKYFYTAFCNVQMMISQTEVLYDVYKSDALSNKELEIMSGKMYEASKMLRGILKKDRERFKKLE